MRTSSGLAFLAGAVAILPAVSSAASVTSLLQLTSTVGNALIGILITLAIVATFWGVVRYLFSAGPDTKAQGMKTAMYGIGAIFIMVSIWGIIALMQNTTGVGGGQPPDVQGPSVHIQ